MILFVCYALILLLGLAGAVLKKGGCSDDVEQMNAWVCPQLTTVLTSRPSTPQHARLLHCMSSLDSSAGIARCKFTLRL